MKVAISVSTYKKNKALEGWLGCIPEHFGPVEKVHVSDDEDGFSEESVVKLRKIWEGKGFQTSIDYSTGKNGGISINKNRSIKWFLENALDCDLLILSDDDIIFSSTNYKYAFPTISDAFTITHKVTKEPHIAGYLSWYNDPLSQKAFFEQFPPIAENEHLWYCGGSQGVFLSFTREAIQKAGYFNILPTRYGYEHILYSQRVHRLYGKTIDLFAFYKQSRRYINCQGIPNNYEVIQSELKRNDEVHFKIKENTFKGIDLYVSEEGSKRFSR